jgi:hypothetical protein
MTETLLGQCDMQVLLTLKQFPGPGFPLVRHHELGGLFRAPHPPSRFLVKFTDHASGLHIDINVNERLGLINTGLIKTYCDIVPNLRYLVSAIKQWARPRALNQPSASAALRTFNSYALVLMTIGWLQVWSVLLLLDYWNLNV